MRHSKESGFFSQETLDFQEKVLRASNVGEDSYFPTGCIQSPPETNMKMARAEAEEVMFACLDDLFAKTGYTPRDIDILIVNCSLFCPTPSLTSMIVNKYKMKTDIYTTNLGGMGCSAGLISIALARDLLQVKKDSIAVIVSTENITQNWYKGNQKSMLIPNVIFRMGGAAILLSNRSQDFTKAKYTLDQIVRTHHGSKDRAYQAIFQEEDEKGYIGVRLAHTRELVPVIGDCLRVHLYKFGRIVLPYSEQIAFFVTELRKKFLKHEIKSYTPKFNKIFNYVCIHAGGKAIIDKIKEELSFSDEQGEPSVATLDRMGNTSSSSVWYELQYIEKHRKPLMGQKVWQLSFGSGVKINSAVWKALKNIN